MSAKYFSRKISVDGIVFDSKKEAARWLELKLLENLGEIRCLERQVVFELIPAIPASNGLPAMRRTTYKADFVYQEKLSGNRYADVIEDVKGFRTEVYRLKQKLMRSKGYIIREV